MEIFGMADSGASEVLYRLNRNSRIPDIENIGSTKSRATCSETAK
jgi:hypothetical protein